MDNHSEQKLRDDIKDQMESFSLPEDMLTRIVDGHQRRKRCPPELLAGGGALAAVILVAGLVFEWLWHKVAVNRLGPRWLRKPAPHPLPPILRSSPIRGRSGRLSVTFLRKVGGYDCLKRRDPAL